MELHSIKALKRLPYQRILESDSLARFPENQTAGLISLQITFRARPPARHSLFWIFCLLKLYMQSRMLRLKEQIKFLKDLSGHLSREQSIRFQLQQAEPNNNQLNVLIPQLPVITVQQIQV